MILHSCQPSCFCCGIQGFYQNFQRSHRSNKSHGLHCFTWKPICFSRENRNRIKINIFKWKNNKNNISDGEQSRHHLFVFKFQRKFTFNFLFSKWHPREFCEKQLWASTIFSLSQGFQILKNLATMILLLY